MAKATHDEDDCENLHDIHRRTSGAVVEGIREGDVDPDLVSLHSEVEKAIRLSGCPIPDNERVEEDSPDCEDLSDWHRELDDTKLEQASFVFRDDVAFEPTVEDETYRYNYNRAATAAQVQIEEEMGERGCEVIPREKETPKPPGTVECVAMSDEDRQDCLEKYEQREGARYTYNRR